MHDGPRSGIHEATRRGLICVLARPAAPGLAKTRLAPVLGADWAAELGRAFLADTWRTATRLASARAVLVQHESEAGLSPRLVPEADLVWQLDPAAGELGARVERLIEQGLQEAPWVIVLATDTPALPPSELDVAAQALRRGVSAVVGPSEHGGWYLLGLRRSVPGLLDGLTSATGPGSATRANVDRLVERLRAGGVAEPLVLEPVYEVEQPADLARLRAELRSGVVKATATARALRRSASR